MLTEFPHRRRHLGLSSAQQNQQNLQSLLVRALGGASRAPELWVRPSTPYANGAYGALTEKLRWVRKAATPQAARWRLTRFLNHADEMATGDGTLAPVRKAIATVRQQIDRIIQRWYSTHSNARLKGLNAIFQAARHRARGYSSATTFIAMIYLLAAPIGDISKSI
jgi:hypothetical protein